MTRMANRVRSRTSTNSGGDWITTYADMVTLILAFFVIMFSMSTIDAQKFERALISMQEALGILHGGRTVTAERLMDMGELKRDHQIKALDLAQILEVRAMVERGLVSAGKEGEVSYVLDHRGLTLRFADSALFPSSQAMLTPEARTILDAVGMVIVSIPNHIRVEGHTDDRPISTPEFPSNWELSTARATNVIRYLLEVHLLQPERLSAAGYGEYRPIDSNETYQGMQSNRRVDVVILRLSLSRNEPE